MLSIGFVFCQFQSGIAFKSIAYTFHQHVSPDRIKYFINMKLRIADVRSIYDALQERKVYYDNTH